MEKLKQVLAQEDTVLFIGSGISLWSGLPSWSGLIEELAKFVEASGSGADLVRAEAKRGDLLQAASYGFDKLTKQQIGDFIRATCRYGMAKPHEIHRKIVSLKSRCFITTNYDNLLEEALREWQPNRFYPPPVTNRHLTETARIANARSIDFIFKPHGDAADSSSIILTREQYRMLLPQGELHHALETLKTLLVSRPVVYLGFGLRDPDFIYVRDLLANTYKGGARDHHAIMADVTEAECDYWRRNYGVHLVNYSTGQRPDGMKDHAALLTLLDSLAQSEPEPVVASPGLKSSVEEFCPSDLVLSLARHAARLARIPKAAPEFTIRVHSEPSKQKGNGYYHQFEKFDHYPIDKFLDEGPDRALLIGLPGAGKTYALRQAAARLAEKLHEVCLSEPFDFSSAVIPIFVDLKLYRGNLVGLVSETLSPSLSFSEITQRFRSKIYLDSFNEMPREYWENGSYELDFANFVESVGRSSMIIGSRTNDGLEKLGFNAYSLDQIDEDIVISELTRIGIEIEGRFNHEVVFLLQKPFFFNLVTTGAVSLPKEAHPRDFYRSFFTNLGSAFIRRFGKSFPIEDALSVAAYDAINRGEEAYPLSDLLQTLRIYVDAADLDGTYALDIANWLVSSSTLIPQIGGRISFVHQSVTEYLAAKELANRYLADPQILKEKIRITRWDQALFFALGLLPQLQAEKFFSDVAKADLALALNAAKYLEAGRDEVVSKLLAIIPEYIQDLDPFESQIESIVENSLPVSESHEPHLRNLMKLGNTIAAAAVKRLVAMKGADIKDELLQELFENRHDYNYCCNGIATALMPFASPEDVKKIVDLADSIADDYAEDYDSDAVGGFISGAADFLSELEISAIKDEFLSDDKTVNISDIRADILCHILMSHHSTPALDLAGELLLLDIKDSAVAIYFVARFSRPEDDLSWESFKADHVENLINMVESPDKDSWALKALKFLCSGRPDLAEVVKARASNKSGIAKAALLYSAQAASVTPIFEALRDLVEMSQEERKKQPVHLLKQIEIDWTGNDSLFVDILRLRDSSIALSIIDQIYHLRDCPLQNMEIGPVEWSLDWLISEIEPDTQFMLRDRISWLFATCLSKEGRHALVNEFNRTDSKYRDVLSRSILLHQNDLTTEDFSADAVSYLLADLARNKISYSWNGHLLGKTATEQFVSERLLPLVHEAKDVLLINLKKILRETGSRHGRRYILD